ncbi:hypothetical protein [Thermococcus sp.]|uniref:hypothetical protein n=1 Tax=Thermococcus sp. TaxID=35749 RepID=UPI00261CD75C|nr:hypothetical protein [Thermococcus sp.]
MNLENIVGFFLIFLPAMLLIFIIAYVAVTNSFEDSRKEWFISIYLGVPYIVLLWTVIMSETKNSLLGWALIFGFLLVSKTVKPQVLIDGLTLGSLVYLSLTSKVAFVGLLAYILIQLKGWLRENLLVNVILLWASLALATLPSISQAGTVIFVGAVHIITSLKLSKVSGVNIVPHREIEEERLKT